jgi:hypothetical protein
MVDQKNRAVSCSGHLTEHGGHSLDLLVRVFIDLVGFDEWVDDQKADVILLDPGDAGIDVGQALDRVTLLTARKEQRAIGAGV